MDRLSAELLDVVVSSVSTRDRISLSQASRYIHNKVAPSIYTSWSYNGESHCLKSLFCFLRTMVLHPWLARRVKALDIRGWGDYTRPQGPRSEGLKFAKDKVDSSWKYDFGILQRAIRDLELDGKTAAHYEQSIQNGSESILLALVISRLPALQTLYMIVPESWDSVRNVLLHGSRNTSNICRNLHTIYICQAWSTYARGRRECSLDLFDATLPLCNIPSLRSLQTLTSHTFPSTRSHSEFKKFAAKSFHLTEIALDESFIDAQDLLTFITLPKALKVFRWGQLDGGFTYHRPPSSIQRALVEGLKAQKDTLESLDLNGIAPIQSETGTSRVRSEHLIGSLKEFVVLRTLSIPALALCGDRKWGLALQKLVGILPTSLETLNLRVEVIQERYGKMIDEVWMERMVELVLDANSKLPALRKVALLVTTDWRPSPEDDGLFERLEDACAVSKIALEVRNVTMFGLSPVPYFQGVRMMRS